MWSSWAPGAVSLCCANNPAVCCAVPQNIVWQEMDSKALKRAYKMQPHQKGVLVRPLASPCCASLATPLFPPPLMCLPDSLMCPVGWPPTPSVYHGCVCSHPRLVQVRSVGPASHEASVLRSDDVILRIDGQEVGGWVVGAAGSGAGGSGAVGKGSVER